MTLMPDTAVRTPLNADFWSRRIAAACVLGLLVGAATSGAQTVLGGTAFAGLANAVSPWVVAPFLIGAAGRGRISASVLGLIACVGEVAGYYVTAAARGFGINPSMVGLWVVAGVVGGLVFGLAGRSWRSATGRERGLGAALLIAVWWCEAIVTYGVELGYLDDAVVFAVVGAGLGIGLGRHDRQHAAIAAWLAPALVLGVGGELALWQVL
jgi:hypothetical protein